MVQLSKIVRSRRFKKVIKWTLVFVAGFTILGGATVYGTLSGMFPSAKKILLIQWIAKWKLNYPEMGSHDCTATWSPSVDGTSPYLVALYPETKAAYWMLPIGQNLDSIPEPIAYRLQGQFPYARYMSFHGYDASKGDYFMSFKDTEIQPDAGSVNPYVANIDRNLPNRSYTMWIVPDGARLPQIQNHPNVITIPPHVTDAPFVLRVYRPDEGRDILGGVSLPSVQVFHAQTGVDLKTCAPLKFAIPEKKTGKKTLHNMKMKITGKEIRHYRLHSGKSGNYPCEQNTYTHTRLDKDFGEIAILKWKAPTVPATKNGGGTFTHEENLRYWSLCIGGMNATNTSDCMVDDQALKDEEGYVTLAIGPNDDGLKNLAQENDINYMQWGIHFYPETIHRNMEGERYFKYGIKQVPVVDIDQPLEYQGAEHVIGVYSPSGYYCSETEFRNNFCEIQEYVHPGLPYME